MRKNYVVKHTVRGGQAILHNLRMIFLVLNKVLLWLLPVELFTCIMFSNDIMRHEAKVEHNTLYHALWVVDEYLDQLDIIFTELNRHILV